MNLSWPHRAAEKSARRSAARVGILGAAVLTVAGAAALAAPAMSAMAATGTNTTTTVVTNPLFPITEPEGVAATVDVEVTDTSGGPAPTGTVLVTTDPADAPWVDNAGLPAGEVYDCTVENLTPVADTDYSTGSCTIGGSPIGYGFVEVGVIYSGDANNAPSSTDGTEVKIVNLYPDTVTVTPGTATAGKAVTLTATLGGPTGGNVLSASPEIETAVPPNPDTINFTVTNAADDVVATCPYVPLLGGTTAPANYANCSVTLPAGTYTVDADFQGDEYAAPYAGTGTLTVNAAPSATTTTISGASGYVDSKITLAAKVAGGSTPTGTVKFVYGGKTLCAATVSNGTAKCGYAFSSVGSFKVVAEYGGDATHGASDGVATVKVTKQPTSVKVTASDASTGKAVKLTATVKALTAATGTVTFYVNGHKVATEKVSGGKASFSYTWHATGTYKVTAVYSGNSTHLGSTGTDSVKVS